MPDLTEQLPNRLELVKLLTVFGILFPLLFTGLLIRQGYSPSTAGLLGDGSPHS